MAAGYRAPILFALALLVTAHGIWVARSLDTFKLADQLRRVAAVADYINVDVPPAAVIVAGEQSGSMRYYTDRPILRWESASPDALAAAITTLEQSRRPVYVVLDAWEHELFRAKFGALPIGALDWPPMLDAGRRTERSCGSRRSRAVRPRREPDDHPIAVGGRARAVEQRRAHLNCRSWPPLETRETTSRSPNCAPSLKRTIPISALPEAESRVQSVSLDAVSTETESAFLESITPANAAGRGAACRRAGRTRFDPQRVRAAGSSDYRALRARGINSDMASR